MMHGDKANLLVAGVQPGIEGRSGKKSDTAVQKGNGVGLAASKETGTVHTKREWPVEAQRTADRQREG